tara:strand:- start:552 stop:2030 length:1479 start_codon:yes stop_codon:yes gene_type:complete
MGNNRFLLVFRAVIGGFLAGISLLMGESFLMPIAIAALWSVYRQPFASSLWGGSAVLVSHFWLLSLHPLDWIGISSKLSLPIAISIWFFCGLFGAVLVGLWSYIGKKIQFFHSSIDSNIKKNFIHAFVLACLWGLVEVFLGQLPLFWIGIGASALPGDRWLAGMAQWFGGGGLAAFQLLIGWWVWQTSIAFLYARRWKKLFFVGFLSILLIHLLGLSLLTNKVGSSSQFVAIWQPDIPIRKKFSKDQVKIFPYALQSAIEKADESSADFLIAPEGSLLLNQELISPAPIKLLAGGFRWVNGRQRNSMLFFDIGNKNYSKAIDKHRLVPLGEWIPDWLGSSFSGLSAVGGIEKGPAPRIFVWEGPPFAASICYEISNGKAISQAVLEGAQWILATANLDPYPQSLQRQFLALSQLRSIENSREIITVANNGPSSWIDSEGKVKLLLPSFEESFGVSKLYLKRDKTLYSKLGEIPLMAMMGFVLCWYCFLLIKA